MTDLTPDEQCEVDSMVSVLAQAFGGVVERLRAKYTPEEFEEWREYMLMLAEEEAKELARLEGEE